jgi:hypothetical protein
MGVAAAGLRRWRGSCGWHFSGAAIAISVSPGTGAILSMASGLAHRVRRGYSGRLARVIAGRWRKQLSGGSTKLVPALLESQPTSHYQTVACS